jgi:hypothetical protein
MAPLRERYGSAERELNAATDRASLLYDIEGGVIADAKIEPLAEDERSLAKERVEALGDMGLHLVAGRIRPRVSVKDLIK